MSLSGDQAEQSIINTLQDGLLNMQEELEHQRGVYDEVVVLRHQLQQESVARQDAESKLADLSRRHTLPQGGYPHSTPVSPRVSEPVTNFSLSRERKLRTYQGGEGVDLWVEDAKRCITSFRSTEEKVAFLLENLGGYALEEVLYRPSSVRESPDSIFDVLVEVFEGPDSVSDLYEAFYARDQIESEGLLQYSLVLMKLWDRIERKLGHGTAFSRDRTLCDKFTSGVRCGPLQCELRSLRADKPSLTFYEFRKRAIDFLGGDNKTSNMTVTANQSRVSMPSNVTPPNVVKQEAFPHVAKGTAAAPIDHGAAYDRLSGKMEQVIDMMKLVLQCRDPSSSSPLGSSGTPQQQSVGPIRSGFRRNGPVRCYGCNATDHLLPDCPLVAQVKGLQTPSTPRRHCYGCSATDHLLPDCPLLAEVKGLQTPNTMVRRCYGCSATDHFIIDCPLVAQVKELQAAASVQGPSQGNG